MDIAIEKIKHLPFRSQLAFAYLACERLYPNYPVVASAYDYYPFGMYMPGRYTEDTNVYCFTATITENVTELTYTPLYLGRAWHHSLFVG